MRKEIIGKCVLYNGDCLEVLGEIGNGVSAVVTDPPYHLISIVKRFGKENSAPAKSKQSGVYSRSSKGFMGQEWDGGDIAFRIETWQTIQNTMLPGAHLCAFSGTKTYHKMAYAIEEAGFEFRDMISWVYGSGFPKSHNLKDDWEGWGTALKPSNEPIALARKPLKEKTVAKNVLRYGTGALNIEVSRIATNPEVDDPRLGGNGSWSTDNMAKNTYGDFEGKSVESSPTGRWPANLAHDGSEEVLELFPHSKGQQGDVKGTESSYTGQTGIYGAYGRIPTPKRNDSGSAARFFYCAKATRKERGEYNNHPTVKPVRLMEWLVNMITPPNGIVLDPFMGSASTALACMNNDYHFIGVEKDEKYFDIACKRIEENYKNNLKGMFE